MKESRWITVLERVKRVQGVAAPAHPCARPLSTPAFRGITTSLYGMAFVRPSTAKANVLFFDKKPASETPWTKKLWIYDLRANMHFTLKTDPLKREDLDEFVKCYNAENRHNRKATRSNELDSGSGAGMTAKGKKKQATPPPRPLPQGEGGLEVLSSPARGEGVNGRWPAYTYDEIAARDKVSLDIFWLQDESLSESQNLPDPAALEQFREIAGDLRGGENA